MVSQSFFLALGVLGGLAQGAGAGTKKKCTIRTSSGLSLTTASTPATSSIPGSTSQTTSSLLSDNTGTSSGLTTSETQTPTSLSSQASTVSDSASISVSISGSAFTSSTASASNSASSPSTASASNSASAYTVATGSSTMSASSATLTSTTTTSTSISTSIDVTSSQTSISSTQSTSVISDTLSTATSSSITTSASSSQITSGSTSASDPSSTSASDPSSTSSSDTSSTTTTSQTIPTRPIFNGGFEDSSNNISPWTLLNGEGGATTIVVDTSISQYGSNSAKLVSPISEDEFLTQTIYKPLVQPNQDYTFSAWFRISGSSFPDCANYRLFCSSQDGSNAGQPNNFWLVAGDTWQVGSTTCRWSQSQYDAGNLIVNLGFSCGASGAATVWIDSAALSPAPTGA